MAQDPTPLPAPEPAPKHGRGLLNKAQSEELTKADQIGIAAQKADRPVTLAARDISSGFVTQALADITAARAKSTEAVTDTTGTRTASVAEDTSERSLIAAMQEVQTAAKQKYARTQPEKLQDYYVGRKLLGNRALLEQYSQGIINKLGSDTLPGITPAKIAALGTLRTAYISTNSAQTGSQSDATTAPAPRWTGWSRRLRTSASPFSTPPMPNGRTRTKPTRASGANSSCRRTARLTCRRPGELRPASRIRKSIAE